METQTSYYYGNSSTRNGTCMDSPPPPYMGEGDLSYEGVKFYVVGSGRKVVPCQHCRRDFGTFETLLLHSEGLKKGSVRNEVIFTVNVLERYNATGNYQLADVRPPLYQIPSSSHFGAEYCRHCNQVDSLTNKPLSCASTRAETSSHGSLSDVEQFSNSLGDNAPSTNKYVSKYDHPEDCSPEDNLTSGQHHQNGQSQTTKPEGHRHHINSSQRHQDFIPNSNQRTQYQKRSSSPKNKTKQDSQHPMIDFSTQQQTDDIHSDSPELDDFTNESKTHLQNNKLKSMTLPYYPGVAPQKNEVFLAEDVKKLKDTMGSRVKDVLKKKKDTKSPYIDNEWGKDIEALKNELLMDSKTKNIINILVEKSIKSLISSNQKELILSDAFKDSESKVSSRKGGSLSPLEINAYHVELNKADSKEFVAEKSLEDADKNGHNDNPLISNNEEFSESTHVPQDIESYTPSQKVDIESHNNYTSDIMQTPVNDSGIFFPGSNFSLSQKKFELEYNESNSFRHSSYNIASDIGSPPDAKIAEKWENRHYIDYDNGDISSGDYDDDDDDNSNNNNNNNSNVDDDEDEDANVTNSCKSEAENYDSQRNMTCETSSETATVCSTSSAYNNDEENDGYKYEVTNSVMSPRDSFAPSISSTPWDDFCPDRLDCHNSTGNDNPSPDQTFCGHKQKLRRTSGEDTQPTITSLKKNFTTFKKIENTPIINQETPKTFSTPRHSHANLLDSDSPEWDSEAVESIRCEENSSSKDSNRRRHEKRERDKPQDSGYISVAKRLNFENCSSPTVSDITNAATATAETAETINVTPSHSVSEASLANTTTSQPQQNKEVEINETCQNRQQLPSSTEEKNAKKTSTANVDPLKRDLPAESAHPKKQPRRVKINDKRQTDCSCKVNKDRFPLKEPDQEALTTCKARAILQSLETSSKTIGTYTPVELENVRTKSSAQNLLFTGGPFQADQNFRSWLADIVCNKNGQYIVSDWSNCCVQMFSTAGLPGDRVTFTSGPWGLALMNESVVACTVPHAKQISLLSHGSRLVVVGLVSTIRRYWGIAVTKNQHLVCSCIQGIDLLTRDGKILRTIQYNEVELEFFVFPQYLTVGDNGVIYVSDSCGTYLIGLPEDGDFSFSFKPLNGIKLKTPRAIEYGRDGFVYIADTDTDKIYRIKEDGTLDSELFTAADNVQGPLAITLRDNKMIVTQKDSSILILPI